MDRITKVQHPEEGDGNMKTALLSPLIVRWSLFGGKQKKLMGVKRSSIREPTRGAGYEDLVAAQSRALATLSREIAAAIKTGEQNLCR